MLLLATTACQTQLDRVLVVSVDQSSRNNLRVGVTGLGIVSRCTGCIARYALSESIIGLTDPQQGVVVTLVTRLVNLQQKLFERVTNCGQSFIFARQFQSSQFFLKLHSQLGVGCQNVLSADFFQFRHRLQGLIDLLRSDIGTKQQSIC